MKLRYIGESFYDGFGLTKNKVYKCVGIEKGFFRIIDDEGEDYLYLSSTENWEIVEDEDNKLSNAFKLNNDIIEAHDFSINNEETLSKDTKCGCFNCLKIFNPKEINEWIDDDKSGTAICPYCGVDSIIGESSNYPITEEFLRAMRDYWLG